MPQRCGMLEVGSFATAHEVSILRQIAERGMVHGGGGGGPTVLDLYSGALSSGGQFISIWHLLNRTGAPPIASANDLDVLEEVHARAAAMVERSFGMSGLRPAAPTFWSRIQGGKQAQNRHDEYWHAHVDTEQYGSFTFTCLLYLADLGRDFEGGEFELLHANVSSVRQVVVPRAGMLLLFTSGPEHPHRVRKVRSGTRLVLTIPFTCDADNAMPDTWLREARASLTR